MKNESLESLITQCGENLSELENTYDGWRVYDRNGNTYWDKDPKEAVRQLLKTLEVEVKDECHCGKNGHALNSINCPVHGTSSLPEPLEMICGFNPDIKFLNEERKAINKIIRYLEEK